MRILAFGDLESQVWGVCCLGGDETSAALAVAHGSSTARIEVGFRPGGPDQDWFLEAEGASLAFSPTAYGGRGQDPGAQLRSEDQLCQVSGQLTVDGVETQIGGLGWRTTIGGEPDPGRLDSLRFLAGWLDPDFGFSLLSLRPRKARGHEADVVAAVVLEDPPLPPVVDPRLSTTYTEAGRPAKAGLELWLQEDETEGGEDNGSSHYPRRAAGEVVGAGLEWKQGELTLQAGLLRWHSHGHTGPGVYVLGQPE